MKKLLLCILVICFSSVVFCEDLFFVESTDLRPDINKFKNMDSAPKNRRLYFEDGDLFYTWSVSDNVLKILSPEEVGFHPLSFSDDKFWNPHTENSYVVLHEPDGFHNGLYKLTFTNDHTLILELQDSHYTEPPFKIHKNRIFQSEYTGSNPSEAMISYSIVSDEGDVIWNRVYNYPANDISYISDAWLLIEARGSDTVLNYETGEEVSFEPELVIGYGKGVILTTLSKNEKEFTGITVWTPEKEILYRDENFPLSEIMLEGDSWLFPLITSARFDYPYIYCNTSLVWGSMQPHYGVIVMDLEMGKTYVAPHGSRALAVFEEK